LLIGEQAVSPRLGFAYYIPRTKTTLRASYNRLFQPPPAENLLLASSPDAAAISPISVLQGVTTLEPVLPDKEHAYEAGAQQLLSKYFRLNLTLYQKRIKNFSDKDQFFETGVIFPIAISSGRVTGEELRWKQLTFTVSADSSHMQTHEPLALLPSREDCSLVKTRRIFSKRLEVRQ
jgi:outer membrane receptor protein involved in Fe transport